MSIDEHLPTLDDLRRRTAPQKSQFVRGELDDKVPSCCAGAMTFNIYACVFVSVLALSLWIIVGVALSQSPFADLSPAARDGITSLASVACALDILWLLYALRYVLSGGIPCNMPTPPKLGHIFQAAEEETTSQTVTLKHVYIIANTNSGSGSSLRILEDMLLPRLEAAGCTYTLLVTAYPAHAYDYANLAPLDGIDAIVVLGGDGSLMETVTGLLHRADGRRVPLALLPLGTGNGFAADVGCWRVAEAVDRLLRGEVVSVDVNRVRDEGSLDVCSVNVVALGLIGDVAVAAERCRWLGPSRYNLCGMWGLLKNERRAMRVEYTAADGSSAALDCPLVTAFVSHTQHFGKGLRVAPRAQLDDGLADLTLVADASRSRMLGLFAQLPLGAHTERPDAAVRQTQVRACSLAPGGGGGGGVVNIDGEMFAFTGALRVECQRRAFQLLAPASAVPVAAQQLGGVSER